MMQTNQRMFTVLLGCTLAIGAVACSDDGDPDSAADETTSSSTTTTAAAPETIEVVAVDYAFEGVPESVPAGSKLTFRNDSDGEIHEIVALKINADEATRTVEDIVQLSEAEFGAATGAPATVLLAAPGAEQIDAVGDGTLSNPGRYVLMCFIPQGADPEEYLTAAQTSEGPPDVAGGPPHFTLGMFAELNVE